MAKIVQSLTRASKEYEERTFQSLVRDLDGVINKLNTSFQLLNLQHLRLMLQQNY